MEYAACTCPDGFFHDLLPNDTWDTRTQIADYGAVRFDGQAWHGSPDAAKTITVSYTATDLSPTSPATATATYELTLHDAFENWRRVDRQGNPLGPNASAENGSVVPLGSTTGTSVPSGPVSIMVTSPGVNWSAAGINGGGVLSGAGAIVSVASDFTWIGLLIGLAGLTVQTAASQPSDPPVPTNSPDQMNLAFLQTAYQNTGYNLTAQPGQEVTDNLMDYNFYIYCQRNVANKQDWNAVYNSLRGQVTVDTNMDMQMLNYYFYGDQYDNAGLVTTTAPGLVSRPGKLLWFYQWHLAGTPTGPGPVDPNPGSNSINPMPAL